MAAKTKGLSAEAREKIVKAQASRWKKARGEQAELPGMGTPVILEVEDAAQAFAEAKQDQQDAATITKNCEEALIRAMKRYDLRYYNKHGIKIELDTKDKAKVKIDADQKKPRDERRNPNATE